MLLQGGSLPGTEKQRLQALRPYQAMAQSRQHVFEEITRLTGKIFLAPTVLLTLVGADTVIYAGNVGLPNLPASASREDTICAVAVYQPSTTIFPDLQTFPCPWVQPEIQAQSGIRFYAGQPLKTEAGQPVGTLCVMDQQTRAFSAEEQLVLQRLATTAMRLLDLQLALENDPKLGSAVWQAINNRVALSIQRIETLTALAGWEPSSDTPEFQAYQTSMHEERLLITQEIDCEISLAFAQLSNNPMQVRGLA